MQIRTHNTAQRFKIYSKNTDELQDEFTGVKTSH